MMDDHVSRVTLHEIQVSHRTLWLLVEVETEDGLTGLAECSDAWRPESASRFLESAVSQLGGHSTSESPEIIDTMLSAITKTEDNEDAFDRRMVNGALVTALCDIWAQRSDAPLGEMLGGIPQTEIPLYANINRAPRNRDAQEFASVARDAVEVGFEQIKLAPFDGPAIGQDSLLDSGLDVLRAVHRSVAGDAAILVDIHHRLSRTELETAVRAMEEIGVGWIEDAVDVQRPEQLEWLAGFTDIPLAGGEQLTSPADFAAVSRQGFLDYVLIDPKYVGSPFSYVAVLAAIDGDMTLTQHNPTSPVSTATCAQLAMLTPQLGPLEVAFGEPVERSAMTEPAEKTQGGSLVVSTQPGIGIELRDPVEHFSPSRVRSSSWEVARV